MTKSEKLKLISAIYFLNEFLSSFCRTLLLTIKFLTIPDCGIILHLPGMMQGVLKIT